MSRRESRVSGAVMRNDALFEYEALKKKFLHANKAITKLNSTLSIRVEELNAELSSLYVENLRLRTSELALAAQLKQERERSRKILADAEAAALNLTKQLEQLRQSYKLDVFPPTPPTPPSPKARRPPLMPNAETQINRLSRPPNVPEIQEEDEPAESTESDTDKPNPFQRRTTTKSRSPVPGVPRQARPASPPLRIDLSATSHRKKPSRRQSGILNVNKETLALQRPPSPSFGSPIRKAVTLAQEDNENEAIDESKSRHRNKMGYRRRDSKFPDKALLENDRATFKPRERKRPRDEDESDRNEEPIKHVSRFALQPIDNTVQDTEDKNAVKACLAPSTNHSIATQAPAPSLPNVTSETETAAAAPSGRERRSRKSVNYTEPKLNTKMRKPDPPLGNETTSLRKKRSSAAAVMTTSMFKSREAEAMVTNGNTGSDTETGTPPPEHPRQDIDSNPLLASTLAQGSARKKYRPKPPSDDEDSEGAEADEEFIPTGRPSWINIEGRKRNNLSRRPFSTTPDPIIDTGADSRRHSLAV
ncbi:hypothetical protein M378DRAFT_158246 [Amanita muscaria Koide BX008]|uniref:Shugoshin n=1 Tax=Amanita muscaria (strain Koide BX008) TaxID=946122 RepID=A0A0C2SY57_AMAMK|nr:hypothetical protein M378DRAFT_158246 [Amanita muscaria Koide BX008]